MNRPTVGRFVNQACDYATLKSFQRLFIYAASSISVFQQEMLVTRSRNEPPSRLVPAFSIGTP